LLTFASAQRTWSAMDRPATVRAVMDLLFAPAPAIAPRSDDESARWEIIGAFARWTSFWVVLFYVLGFTMPCLAGWIPQSSKAYENNRHWVARDVLGIVHAIIVCGLILPPLVIMLNAPDHIRFGAGDFLGTCASATYPDYNLIGQAIALGGLVFSAFIFADVVISMLHGLATLDYYVHHAVFLAAGVIIRGHCMLPLNAAILLSMEASTPFLNFMLFFRNRGPRYTFAVRVTGILFVVLFVAFRLALNTYGAILLWRSRDFAYPDGVPRWQSMFLLGAVQVGSALQFYWFPAIARTFGKGILELFSGSAGKISSKNGSTANGGRPAGMEKAADSLKVNGSRSEEGLSKAKVS